MTTEQDCIDSISRINDKIRAVESKPQQAGHWKQLIRERAGWISLLNKIRSKSS